MLKNVGVTNSPQYLGEAQRIKNVNCSYALRVELIVGWSTHSKIFINMKITADVLFSPLTESNFFLPWKKEEDGKQTKQRSALRKQNLITRDLGHIFDLPPQVP